MENLLNNPMVQSSLLPLLISLIVAGVVGFSSVKGQRFAVIAVAISAPGNDHRYFRPEFSTKSDLAEATLPDYAGAMIGLLVDALNIKGWSYKLVSLIILWGWLAGCLVPGFPQWIWPAVFT